MDSLKELLILAEEIAREAHKGQLDKVGEPYINHPMRVSSYCTSLKGKIVGWLHDVVEDTNVTLESLANKGFDEEIIEALRCVTKENGYDIDEYYARIKVNNLAKEVKLADLKDNTDESRIPDDYPIDKKKQLARMREKYYEHIEFLKRVDNNE